MPTTSLGLADCTLAGRRISFASGSSGYGYEGDLEEGLLAVRAYRKSLGIILRSAIE